MNTKKMLFNIALLVALAVGLRIIGMLFFFVDGEILMRGETHQRIVERFGEPDGFGVEPNNETTWIWYEDLSAGLKGFFYSGRVEMKLKNEKLVSVIFNTGVNETEAERTPMGSSVENKHPNL